MIIKNSIFNKIKELDNHNYRYTILNFKPDRIVLGYSNVSEEELESIFRVFPMILIKDNKRFQELKSSNIDKIIFKCVSKRVGYEKILFIEEYLKDTTYDYFIKNKEEIINKINSIILSFNFIDFIEKKLNEDFLTKRNISTLNSKRKELDKLMKNLKVDKDNVVIRKEICKIDLLKSKLQKENINKTIDTHKDGYYFLREFFYENNYNTNSYSLAKENNFYSRGNIKEMIELFEEKEVRIIKTSTDLYKEILNESEYTNLYDYDYKVIDDKSENYYEHIYSSLYSSIQGNRILSIDTSFSGEYLSYFLYDVEMINRDVESIIYSKKLTYPTDIKKQRNNIEFRFVEEHSINELISLEYYKQNLIIGKISHRKGYSN